MAPDLPMVWDNAPRHDGKRNVVFFDGHVESVSDVAFAELMLRLTAALEALPE